MAELIDVVVIGAGPAGLMAAIQASKYGKVIVLDGNEKCGKKLYITGKGRCNLTNDTSSTEFLDSVVSNPKFVYSAINVFTPQDTVEFFEQNGMHVVVERGGRVFPVSNKASDVTTVLERVVIKQGAKILLSQKVQNVGVNDKIHNEKVGDNARVFEGNRAFFIDTNTSRYESYNVIIATGGLSYPSTGCDGSGYNIARGLGHKIVTTKAALVPIEFVEDVSALQGLSLRNVKLNVVCDGKLIKSFFGEMIFTNKGASGPIILSTSSIINRLNLNSVKLLFDLKPALDFDRLYSRIIREFDDKKNKLFKNSLDDLLPRTLIPYIVDKSGIDPFCQVNNINREDRHRLCKLLKNLQFRPKTLANIECGIVTAGGIDTKEINPKTMESKLLQGLYFAGEVIDLDCVTGGYNIQLALSTGFLAGSSVGKYIDRK